VLTDGLHAFRRHMTEVSRQVSVASAPAKVQRFVRMHEVGLPLDITVRWYPLTALEAIEARIEKLTRRGQQVWISQGIPRDPQTDDQLASVERKTPLIKGVNTLDDFGKQALPCLKKWEQGSWAKLYYDTPVRALTGGTIGFDTNRHDSMMLHDSRTVRLEAASGISDVRDLQRQMSARKVLVATGDAPLCSEIETALEPMDCSVVQVSDTGAVVGAIRQMAVGEPRVVIVDAREGLPVGEAALDDLKGSADTASVPVILIVDDEGSSPAGLRTRVAAAIRSPVSAEEIRTRVLLTGFRVLGDAAGFQLASEDRGTHREVDRLLKTVMGNGGAYRRMMARVANLEARPTIAFEFKLVPLAPYEFFFIDYEWSGVRHELHRFDWLYYLDAD
jgi:CheY-like chemotaxis protein